MLVHLSVIYNFLFLAPSSLVPTKYVNLLQLKDTCYKDHLFSLNREEEVCWIYFFLRFSLIKICGSRTVNVGLSQKKVQQYNLLTCFWITVEVYDSEQEDMEDMRLVSWHILCWFWCFLVGIYWQYEKGKTSPALSHKYNSSHVISCFLTVEIKQ